MKRLYFRSWLLQLSPGNKEAFLFFLFALTIRLTWVIIAPHLDPFLQNTPLRGDAMAYDLLARNLIQEKLYSLHPPQPDGFWPPLYPWLLAFIYRIAGYQWTIARLVQAFLGALVPVFFYLTALQVANRSVARLTAFGLALYPHLIYFGAWLIAEPLFMALFSAAVWLISTLRALNGRSSTAFPPDEWQYRKLIIIGILAGLCTLAKPAMLFYMPFFGVWLFFAPQKMSLPKRVAGPMVLALSTVLVILPWTIRNYMNFNQIVLVSTNGGYTFLGANNPNAWGGHNEGFPELIPGLNDAEMEDVYYARAIDWIRSDPPAFLHLLGQKYLHLASPLSIASQPADYPLAGATVVYSIYALFLIFAVIGMGIDLKRWRQLGFLYVPIVGVLLSAGLFYGDVRYTLPMAPSLVFFCAQALVSGWQKCSI